jgi:hypothetical protein
MGRLLAAGVVALAAAVIGLAGASPGGTADAVEPPQCPAHSTKQSTLLGGTTPDGQAPLYLRFCGPAHATFQFQQKTYRAQGGFCTLGRLDPAPEGATHLLSLGTGLLTNPPSAPAGTAVALQMFTTRPVPAGPVTVLDSAIQVPGREISGSGIAILRRHGRGGSFWLISRAGDPSSGGQLITGSWTCRFKRS